MNAPYVAVEDLRRWFDLSPNLLGRIGFGSRRQVLKAVDGVSFSIPAGKTFALVGESGCGKSTVAKLIVGLSRKTAGRVVIDGQELGDAGNPAERVRRRDVQMIFQDPYASLNPRWRVGRSIAEPIRVFGLHKAESKTRERVGELLTLVGLHPDDAEKFPHEFSGGQRQRIAIARALSSNPKFIVCDEPTSALDVSVQAQILNLMRSLQCKLGLSFLFISHNLAVVRFMADQIGVMYLGRLVEVGDKAEIFGNSRHPYTRMLLSAVPDPAVIGSPTADVVGEVPNPINPPSGCTFHPRCPLAFDRCRIEAPRLLGGVSCHLSQKAS